MKISIIVGALGALFTGVAISIQSTISSRAGSMIGDVKTGLFTNLLGGLIAGVMVLILFIRGGSQAWKIPGTVIGFVSISGLLGIFIITGISFSLQRVGIAAGLATVILGQLFISVIIDTFGIGGVEAIPLSLPRVMGLVVMGFGVLIMLPRT